ncbi:MAG: peptidase M28, partial [Armatimonadia bacterium]
MSDTPSLLQSLSDVRGISGFESRVARFVRDQLAPIAEVTCDNLGSVLCRLRSSGPGPRVALAGHMDEIGFMVKLVTKEGFVKFQTVGGWWDQVLLGQRVIIETHKGEV